ncbi:hypothetical protein GH714_010134 [Hevea brasiliensis]|uniref:Uncharacterized protein n=1 Tax=Hevea brasiliensis TaxID=3981 RepID=A0A6A6M6P4_HEVBR|nr:hypothetical protein GH714_010134 [Hevea brasiliensis]
MMEEWQTYFRIKVWLNVFKPLVTGFHRNKANGERDFLDIHAVMADKPLRFGVWLSAKPYFPLQVYASAGNLRKGIWSGINGRRAREVSNNQEKEQSVQIEERNETHKQGKGEEEIAVRVYSKVLDGGKAPIGPNSEASVAG